MNIFWSWLGYFVIINSLTVAFWQIGGLPIDFWEVAKDFPVLVLFMGTLYYVLKWGERMLEAQRINLHEIYTSNEAFMTALLTQIENRQLKMDEHIDSLTREIVILRGTLSEVVKVDDVIDRLLIEVRRKANE